MGKKQWLVVLGGLVITALLYAFGNRVSQAGTAPAVAMANEGAKMADVRAASFETILKEAKRMLPTNLKDRITGIENRAQQSTGEQAGGDYKQLAAIWDSLGQRPVSAYYKGQEGKAKQSSSIMAFAANVFLLYQQQATDSTVRKWEINQAQNLLQKAENMDPENDSVQVGLAKIDLANGSPMEAVQRLKKIVEKDPMNIPANMTLGQMSITSGQFSKAIKELEIVINQQPKNVEALYYLAEAYKNSGKKEKAIELFNRTKTLINDPGFSKEIDDYINSFK